MGFGSTRNEARQLISHRTVLVNDKSVNIPSFQVRPSDKITIREKSKNQLRIKDALNVAEQYGFPDWVEVSAKGMEGTFKSVPDRNELPSEINEQLVVELYSK